jgi:hypothetical protein
MYGATKDSAVSAGTSCSWRRRGADRQERSKADGDATDRGDEQVGRHGRDRHLGDLAVGRCPVGGQPGRSQGRAQGDERGRVIEQRLTFEDRRDPPGQADAAGHGGGRHGIRWRDDRSEGDGDGERDRQQQPRDDGHAQGGEEHEPDGQAEDGGPVGPDVEQRRRQGRGVEQRRQQAVQDEVAGERQLRHGRHERQHRPGEQQRDRRRHPDGCGEAADDDDDEHDGHDGRGEFHRWIVPRQAGGGDRSPTR